MPSQDISGSIDASPSYFCVSPVTVDSNNLASEPSIDVTSSPSSATPRTFQVSAVDAAGNLDPSPASFEWYQLGTISPDRIPPSTKIMSAVDSNNVALRNASSISIPSSSVGYQFATPSAEANIITFSFAATDNSNSIIGYECASSSFLSPPEQIAFVPCTNPSISQIQVETQSTSGDPGTDKAYKFQVRAIDTSGNVEPSPVTFLWAVQNTGTFDESMPTGIAASLQQDQIDDSRTSNTNWTTLFGHVARPTSHIIE